MAAHHDAPQPLDHQTFEVQFPDVFCVSQGALTRSRGTLKDSLDWLHVLHPRKGHASHGDLGFAPGLLPLLIEWTRRLAVHIEALDGGTPVGGQGIQRVARSTEIPRDHAAPYALGTVCVRRVDQGQCLW